jgi:hypothetical protein
MPPAVPQFATSGAMHTFLGVQHPEPHVLASQTMQPVAEQVSGAAHALPAAAQMHLPWSEQRSAWSLSAEQSSHAAPLRPQWLRSVVWQFPSAPQHPVQLSGVHVAQPLAVQVCVPVHATPDAPHTHWPSGEQASAASLPSTSAQRVQVWPAGAHAVTERVTQPSSGSQQPSGQLFASQPIAPWHPSAAQVWEAGHAAPPLVEQPQTPRLHESTAAPPWSAQLKPHRPQFSGS